MAVGRAAFHVGVLSSTPRLLIGWVSAGAAGLLSPLRGLALSVVFPKYSRSYLARWWCPFLSGDESTFLFGGSFFSPKRGGFAGASASLATRSSEIVSGGAATFLSGAARSGSEGSAGERTGSTSDWRRRKFLSSQ